MSVRSGLLTVLCLVGGAALAVAVGGAVHQLIIRISVWLGRIVAGAVALLIFILATREWGRRMSTLLRIGDRHHVGNSTGLLLGVPLIVVAAGLASLEQVAVGISSAHGLPVHAAYLGLFVPAAFVIAALGSFGLGRGLASRGTVTRLVLTVAPIAAITYLIVASAMYFAGWQIGAPHAAERSTMLVVTAVSMSATAFVAGVVIGRYMPIEST